MNAVAKAFPRSAPPRLCGEKPLNGFTLVELMVVISIIAFLAATLVVMVPLIQERTRAQGTKGTLGRLKLALSNYHREFGHYPTGPEHPPPPGPTATLPNPDEEKHWVLWKGWGIDGRHDQPNAPLPGKIKGGQGKLVDFLEEKDLVFNNADTYKRWPVDSWMRPIRYTIWRPAIGSPFDPYFLLTSFGPDPDDAKDNIVMKGMD